MGSKGVKDKDSSKKDTALAHYLPHMQKEIFTVYHNVYSDCLDVPLFCLKVLSRLMGYSFIPFIASKVMLLEKTTVLRISDYGRGHWASRAGYFLCYSSYAMADKKTDVSPSPSFASLRVPPPPFAPPLQQTRWNLQLLHRGTLQKPPRPPTPKILFDFLSRT